MIIDTKKLDIEEYLDVIDFGGGFLFDYKQYRFIESIDSNDKLRYVIVKNCSTKKYDDIDPRIDEVEFVELRLLDFHNLCTLYILSLQEGCKEEAEIALTKDLSNLFVG